MESDTEQQANPSLIKEGNEGASTTQNDFPGRGSLPSSYVDMIINKPLELTGSLEEDTFERPSKRAGRKSLKEAREEEAERQKMQGSQSTLEMSISRNTRAWPPKRGLSSTTLNK